MVAPSTRHNKDVMQQRRDRTLTSPLSVICTLCLNTRTEECGHDTLKNGTDSGCVRPIPELIFENDGTLSIDVWLFNSNEKQDGQFSADTFTWKWKRALKWPNEIINEEKGTKKTYRWGVWISYHAQIFQYICKCSKSHASKLKSLQEINQPWWRIDQA